MLFRSATFGMPVIFGPKYKKFREAVDLIEKGGGFSIQSQGEFQEIIDQLMNEDIHNNLLRSGQSSKKYVESMCGATALILNEMNE